MQDISLIDVAQRHAAQTPTALAYGFLRDGETLDEQLSFYELDQRARAIAAPLQRLTAPGDRVLLAYEPGLELVTAFLGCQYAGAVAVPTPPPRLDRVEATTSRMSTIAADARPAVVLTTTDLLSPLEAAAHGHLARTPWQATDGVAESLAALWRRPDIDGSSLSFLQYTSGSTSAPKGVMVSHANLMANLRMLQETAGLGERYDLVGWLPLFHDMGLIGVMLHGLFVGGQTRLMSPLSFLKRPIRWLKAISNQERVFSGGPNFGFDLCLDRISEAEASELDLSGWKVVFSGAETVRAHTLERFYRTFARRGLRREALLPCYGLAEATLVVSARTPGRDYRCARLDAASLERGVAEDAHEDEASTTVVSCGCTKGEQEIAIVDPQTRKRCPDRQVGEIWIRGPNVAVGYWARPTLTIQTFAAMTAEGDGPFMRSGDLGFLDDGELHITGRIKEIIVVRGRCLHPQDIELMVDSMADRFPAIRTGNSVAFAITGAEQEGIGLFVQVRAQRMVSFDPQRLVEALQERLLSVLDVGFAEVVLVKSAIPRTSSGKKMRLACSRMLPTIEDELTVVHRWRRTEAERRPASSPAANNEGDSHQAKAASIVALVTEWIASAEQIEPTRIGPDRSLADFGLDSLAAVSLVDFLEVRLDAVISISQLQSHLTIRDFAQSLSKAV